MTWTTDIRVKPTNWYGISDSPSAVYYQPNNKIYIFHQGRGNDRKIWFATYDGDQDWSDETQPLPTMSGIVCSPSAAVFNDHIFVAYNSPEGLLRIGKMDSRHIWTNIYSTPQNFVSYSPSIAVFRGQLHIVYQGGRGNAGSLMHIQSPDGMSWSQERKIGDINVTGSPAIIEYQNGLHCFHKGTNKTYDTGNILTVDRLFEKVGVTNAWAALALRLEILIAQQMVSQFDRRIPAASSVLVGMSALVEFVNTLKARTSDWLWHVKYDGTNWSQDALCPDAFNAYGINSEGPAVIDFCGALLCFRQGRDKSWLWMGGYNGDDWLIDQPVGLPGNTFCTTGAPALAVKGNTLYCFHQGRDDSGYMWMTKVSAS